MECKNGSKSKKYVNCNTADIRFHRFPKNPFYQQIWSSVCNGKNLNTSNAYICSLHFDADAYCKPLIESLLNYSPRHKRKLKSDAVPTLKLSKLSYDNSSKTPYSLETSGVNPVDKEFDDINYPTSDFSQRFLKMPAEINCRNMAPKRKYDDGYIKFGFIAIETNREIRPQCVICATVLSNDALKPAKLERHLKSIHPTLSDRPPEFFMGKSENLKKMKLGTSGSRFESNDKVLSASFKISQLIAKSKKPHTIGENVIKPCLLTAVEEILGAEAKKKIQEIPLSNNTLLVFVRFLDNDNLIKEELLLLQELGTTSKGNDVMKIINDYFEKHDIMWEKLAGFCTDGAPAIIGSRSGLTTLVKEKKCKVLTTHCIIHRQALASKTLPEELLYTLKQALKLVNTIKSSALNTRIFKNICSDLDSEYETLLFHTEVRWLSEGNMLARLFSLKKEVAVFLTEKKNDNLLKCICDHKFEIHLAYLVDIFKHLNKLNLQLQGSGNNKLEGSGNIFIFEDKLRAFMCKIDLWISKVGMNNYSAFQTLKSLVDNEKYADLVNEVQQNVLDHLKKLKNEFNRYFPEYNDLETNSIQSMIRNPFIVKINEVPDNNQEDLIELQND
ncbi:protein ZBED8-like [Aphis gossypii]|uniref:protein ZBED8-like n=1 Tax=Aphis gossypii TaxID=80765 RepID=UPI002158EE4B|nr:protein ZBED8-like [Aphis gossypii]